MKKSTLAARVMFWVLAIIVAIAGNSHAGDNMSGMTMPNTSNSSSENSKSDQQEQSQKSSLTPDQQQEKENLLEKHDDLRDIIEGVYKNGPPKTPKDENALEGYLSTREMERDIIKPYIHVPGFDFSKENDPNYKAVIGQAITNLAAAAKTDPAARRQAVKLIDLTGRSAQFMNNDIMNSQDKNFANAVMMADPAAHAFMPPEAGRADNNSWVNSSHSPQAYVSRGQDELSAGESKAALADASQAASLDPQNVAAQSLKAQAAFKLGDYPMAAQSAQTVLAINPQDKNALAVYGLSEGRNAHMDNSVPALPSQSSAFQNGQDGGTQNADSLSASLGGGASNPATLPLDTGLAFRMGSFRDALAGANAAIQENPRNLAAYLLAAQSYSQMGDYGQSLKSAQSGLKIDPQNSRLINLNSQTLSRLGRYREALASSDTALEINPQNAEAYYSRAMALAGLGDKAGMLSALQEAGRLNPKYQALVDAAGNLPLNSDLSLLFSGAQNAPLQKSPAFLLMSWLKKPAFRWPLGLFMLFALSTMVLMGRKSFFEPASNSSAIEGYSDSEGQTAILSENRIAGQYQILSRIGSGGMGIVYDGLDVNLGRRVAIKHLRGELQRNADQRGRFLSEARLVAGLDHPNIVRIYSIAEEKGDIYLVFEFVEGKTLQDLLSAKERLSLGEVIGIFKPVAQALDYSHRHGIIHRDLKPSNIMISKEGKALVMDFGVARVAKDALLTSQVTHTIVGTPAYMAPESQSGIVRKESDIYSLAICLYEALTGQLPFPATATGSVNKLKRVYPPVSASGLSASLDPVFARALDPDPAQRFKTPGEFISALEKASSVGSPGGEKLWEA